MKKSVLFALCTLLSGCGNYASLNQQSIQSIQYRCDEGPLQVQRDDVNKKISLSVDGKKLILSQGISAVGQRYSDGVYAFWSGSDNVATIYNHDWVIGHNCVAEPEAKIKELTLEDKLQRWFGSEHNTNADLAQ
jgi:membrane-bound inhibitor of C-type lysozyme